MKHLETLNRCSHPYRGFVFKRLGKQFLPFFALAALPSLGAPELVRPLDAANADAVAEHNGPSLEDELYFSERHRIVGINVAVLTAGSDVQLTPFPDVQPLQLRVDNPISEMVGLSGYQQVRLEPTRNRGADAMAIRAHLPQEVVGGLTDEQLLALVFRPIRLEVHSYDVDAAGNATPSSLNRFRHSPFWEIDESDRPYLREPTDEEQKAGAIAGPPPETPKEIAYHRRLKRLTKNAFYSVETHFNVTHPDGMASSYSLVPLEFSPRYSVLFEWDESKRILGSRDHGVPRSAENQARLDAYEAFRASLQPQADGTRVLGDVK